MLLSLEFSALNIQMSGLYSIKYYKTVKSIFCRRPTLSQRCFFFCHFFHFSLLSEENFPRVCWKLWLEWLGSASAHPKLIQRSLSSRTPCVCSYRSAADGQRSSLWGKCMRSRCGFCFLCVTMFNPSLTSCRRCRMWDGEDARMHEFDLCLLSEIIQRSAEILITDYKIYILCYLNKIILLNL